MDFMASETPQDTVVSPTRNKPNLVSFIALTMIAVPLLATGIIGLSAPEILPWPANPKIAWSLIGVGGVMDLAAVATLLSELKRVQAP